MGTDIFLSWDGMTEEEKKLQHKALWDIGKGEVGYLRATVWMTEEDAMFKLLFPKEIWDAEGEKSYDFDQNVELLTKLAGEYAEGQVQGVKNKVAEELAIVLQEQGHNVQVPNSFDDDDKTKWLSSLMKFFKLGHDLQRAKKNPTVLISW